MRLLHGLVSVGLALLAVFVSGLFWLNTKEAHDQLVQAHFWSTFGLRLFAGLVVGLVGVGSWWLLNLALAKAGWVQQPELVGKMAWVAAGPLLGALAGALLFCLG